MDGAERALGNSTGIGPPPHAERHAPRRYEFVPADDYAVATNQPGGATRPSDHAPVRFITLQRPNRRRDALRGDQVGPDIPADRSRATGRASRRRLG